ncbi:MAG: efflux RND transporter permease subunit, partial [Chloroflexi bacterium]
MRWIVQASLRFRFLVAAGAVLLIAVGTLQKALNGVKGLQDMRSKSVPQLSSIELIFNQGTDEWEARQLVQERLATVQTLLPTWAAPPVMLPPVSATSRVMQIGMSSKDHSLIAMSMMAYWTIRARLLRVPGVANVAIWGERLQNLTVQVDPKRMQSHEVTLGAVMEATSDSVDHGLLKFTTASVIGTGGAIDTGTQLVGIQHVLPIVAPADLARATVESKNGTSVPIGDVAEVKEDHQPLIGDAVIGDSPGLLLVLEKLPWGNTLQITKGVEEAIKALEPGLPGITFDTHIFRQANFIELAIHNLTQAMLLGFLLVVVIVLGFLFEWRVAVISLLTIPLSLLATMLVLYWRGETVNTMTLAGLVIALGSVVDDAVIGVENILRRLRQHRRAGSAKSTASIILEASLEVRRSIVYATLIIVAAAVPIFLLEGLTGAFFRPLAVSYWLAILASMVVALTFTPALCLILLRGAHVERRDSPITRWLQGAYTALLSRIVHRPRRA